MTIEKDRTTTLTATLNNDDLEGDGLLDDEETNGFIDGFGNRHTTDPDLLDTGTRRKPFQCPSGKKSRRENIMHNCWDLSECARKAVAFRDERGFREFNDPKNLAAAISIEAAELEEMFLWRGREEFGEIDRERMSGIADELADIVIYALIFAHDAKIDLRAAVDAKIEKNREKYPLPER